MTYKLWFFYINYYSDIYQLFIKNKPVDLLIRNPLKDNLL